MPTLKVTRLDGPCTADALLAAGDAIILDAEGYAHGSPDYMARTGSHAMSRVNREGAENPQAAYIMWVMVTHCTIDAFHVLTLEALS